MKRLPAIAAVLLLALPAAASAAETVVDPAATGCTKERCNTISGAVEVAAAGDSIRILPGRYSEDVEVDKDLSIDAEPGAVLSGAMTLTAGGVDVLDLVVLSAAEGPAIVVTGSGQTRLQRMLIVGEGGGVLLASNAVGERRLTVDSTAVNNTGGAAFAVTTGAVSGNAVLTLNHVTAARGGAAVGLQAGSLPTSGDITFEARSSILHGESTSADGGVLGGSVTATVEDSDATAMTGAATYAGNATPDDQLFGEGLLLKAGSPVIDKGGAVAEGESDRDMQGDARSIGSATDIGADEYVNHAPTVRLTLDKTELDSSDPLVATTTATDLEGASDIASINVDWGDGTTGSGARAEHTYGKTGTFTVSVTATDKAGATSTPATAQVTVRDSAPPQVLVTNPKQGATVALSGARRAFAVKGVHADASSVAKIEIALTRKTGGCAHFDGKALKRQGCKQPIFVPAVIKGTRFQLKTPALKFRPGNYQVRVRATDTLGNATKGFTKAAKTLVTFKVS